MGWSSSREEGPETAIATAAQSRRIVQRVRAEGRKASAAELCGTAARRSSGANSRLVAQDLGTRRPLAGHSVVSFMILNSEDQRMPDAHLRRLLNDA